MEGHNLGSGREPVFGGSQLRSQFRSHWQFVELSKILQRGWEGLVGKGLEREALETVASMGMK